MTVATDTLVSLDAIRAAADRISGIAVKTPLIRAWFPDVPGKVWLKAESLQPIGSFKIRGAYNKILQLTPEELSRGVITYSSGNHAQGVAYAAREVGAKAVIVMPSNAPEIKSAPPPPSAPKSSKSASPPATASPKPKNSAASTATSSIPPYDDDQIIAGQGTCGLEILEDLPDVDLVLSPVSGGGLLSGIATAIKLLRPQAKVIGVEPELAADAPESFRTGQVVTWPADLTTRTIADGLRTQSLGERNFAHIRHSSTASSPSPKAKSAPPCAPSSTPRASSPSPAEPLPPPHSSSTPPSFRPSTMQSPSSAAATSSRVPCPACSLNPACNVVRL